MNINLSIMKKDVIKHEIIQRNKYIMSIILLKTIVKTVRVSAWKFSFWTQNVYLKIHKKCITTNKYHHETYQLLSKIKYNFM